MSSMAELISVISPSYCLPKSLNLQIDTQNCAAYDEKGNPVYSLNKDDLTLHHRRVLYDDKGNPIVTLYKKHRTLHGRWQVFRGKSSDSSKLLFSTKNSSMIHTGTMSRLDVFRADNTGESTCDFRVITFGNQNSCKVFERESPKVVAKIENNMGFNVWIEPNVDSAFIVALIMIIMEDWKGLKLMHTTGKVVEKVVGGVAGEVAGTAAVAGLAAAGVPWLLPNQGGEEEGGREEGEEGGGVQEENVD